MNRPVPWRWRITARTLIVRFPMPYRTLGWAPLGGGYGSTRVVSNHQVEKVDRHATEFPRAFLRCRIEELEPDARGAVAMMTGARVENAAYVCGRRGALAVAAWCTAGCSNALRAGDRATVADTRPGTINLIVAISQPLAAAAMVEAIQIATEARVLAVQQAGIISTRSGLPATGTGTDCIVVASPPGARPYPWCGKHTLLGEMIARATLKSCARALARSRP
ncbi:MAG: adenosylcobinamide amidohydrolase [Candidatus Binataceae bacterium]